MAFQLSPGVLVNEKDLTSIIPAVATSIGAFAGTFMWGPVMVPTTISSENQLVARFGKPVSGNATSFFTAANFLSYTNNLLLVRADTELSRNAVSTPAGTIVGVTINDRGLGYTDPTVAFSAPNVVGGVQATGTAVVKSVIAGVTIVEGGTGYTNPTVTFSAPAGVGGVRATGTAVVEAGVITDITITNEGSGYTGSTPPTVTVTDADGVDFDGTVDVAAGVITGITITNVGSGYTGSPTITVTDADGADFDGVVDVATGGIKIKNEDEYMTNYVNGAGLVGMWAAKYPGTLGNGITVEMADSATFTGWDYEAEFDSAPGTSVYAQSVGGSNDELHIIVIDTEGVWTGVRGGVMEKFAYVSKGSDAKRQDGTNNYYREVINTNSKYIWWMDHTTDVGAGGAWGTAVQGTTFASMDDVAASTLGGGVDSLTADQGELTAAFDLFANAELYDISLIATGAVTAAVAKHVVENVAEIRKDCVVFVSPATSSGGVITGVDVVADTIAFRNGSPFNVNSSYAVLDSGWKYQYDRYNDVYRWIPLNGDIAGLCARTDSTNDAWWSPGGLNRGQIKNVVKLSINPNQTDRDNLYKNGINPVVTFPGQGTVLFGDKTLLTKPSAFDRINVRRLFIVLEKAIATAAKFQLFEFNDGFTRAQFRSLVEPFLRDVQGRRGVTDFRVKCDETNNTGEVIDRNEFVADIFIKPARSINFITLNFVAARSGISFDEIGA